MAASAVLVTRPAGQAGNLCAALEQRGLRAVHQPLLVLEGRAHLHGSERQVVQDLDQFQHVIFISSNAVRFSMPWLEDFWPQWPLGLHWYAVGEGTARSLRRHGIEALRPVSEMNSEGLLRLPTLRELHRQRVLLVKGEGGRELLRDTLQQRGATVEQLACYSRRPVTLPEGGLATLLHDQQIDLVMLSSGEGLANMLALLRPGETSKLSRVTLLVPSQRVADMARDAGWERVRVADNASDDAMLQALDQWRQHRGDE